MTKTPAAQLDREIAEVLSGSGVADRFMRAVDRGNESDARTERTQRALDVILRGHHDGMIHGQEYKDAKSALSRRFEEAYGDKIRAPYLYGKGYTPDHEWEAKLGSTLGLHSAISVAKRLAKLPPAPTPQFDRDVREFIGATQPIAVMIAGLASKVVKGRKPNPDAVARKAAAAASRVGRDGECQICQRRHLLDSRGNLVLHGYRRPGHGFIVGDCFGVGHPPWEVSSDALATWIEKLKAASAQAAQAAIRVAKLTTIEVNRGSDRNPRMVTLTEGEPRFEDEIERRVSSLKRESEALADAATSETRRLRTWKPAAGRA
jgi:hypothetical protein